MKFAISMMMAFFACAVTSSQAQMARPQMQTFDTSAGPVKITPIEHASTLIEAGGKVIYVDPAKTPNFPSDFTGLPPADLILVSDTHSDHMDPASIALAQQGGHRDYRAAVGRHDRHHRKASGQRRNNQVGQVEDRSDPHVQHGSRPRAGKILS